MPPLASASVAGDDTDESICIDCGMCCDGTIFSRVELPSPGDVAMLVGTPVRIEGSEAEPFFSLPCAAFNGCCSIYTVRPSICRSFRCLLLRRLEKGDVSTEEARRIIRITRDMRDRAIASIRQRLAVDDLSFPELQALLANLPAEEGGASPEHMEMLLDAGATSRLISKHFLPKPPRDATTA